MLKIADKVTLTEKIAMRFALLFFTLLFACKAETAHRIDSESAASSTGDLECPAPEAQECPACEAPVACEKEDGPPPYPKGFYPADQYAGDTQLACQQISEEEAGKWAKPVKAWCNHRVHHSSRGETGNVIKSRIDGSQVHDRDRPSAHWFYEAAKRTGRIDPDNCVHHRFDKLEGHPSSCYKMAADWPFKVPAELPDARKKRWLQSPHDLERFGARGPIDFNVLVGYGALPGCYAPEAFDRVDVTVTALVRRSVRICAEFGCRTKWDIKEHWNDSID